MASRRRERRTDRSKLDATPPWETSRARAAERTAGPYDVVDAPADDLERVDLGALRIPAARGIEVRVEVNDAGEIVTVNLINPSGQLQLGVFAAPRGSGIWDEVRQEIKASISSQGGTVSEQSGEFGVELVGKLPAPGGMTPVRFVGVNGPRWFLRGMLAGTAATSPEQARPFLEAFRSLVVVRGTEPLPVREPIPLNLPKEAADSLGAHEQPGE
jgi:hypothetical protein